MFGNFYLSKLKKVFIFLLYLAQSRLQKELFNKIAQQMKLNMSHVVK